MKDKNIETITHYTADKLEYKPVKNAIDEELRDIIKKVAYLDKDLSTSLEWLTNIMLTHFHEDIIAVHRGDLNPVETNINGIDSKIRKAQLLLLKDGYKNDVSIRNPMWHLDIAISQIEHAKKLSKTASKN